MSLPMRYGSPKTATMNMMNGFREGRGGAGDPSGSFPVKAAKLDGVRSLDEAGSGRPVSLAKATRNHLMRVKIPSTDPNVCLKFPNCSATETIAVQIQRQSESA